MCLNFQLLISCDGGESKHSSNNDNEKRVAMKLNIKCIDINR